MLNSRRDSGHRARVYALLGLAFRWIPAALRRLSAGREKYTPEQWAYFAQDAIAGRALDTLATPLAPAERAEVLLTLARAVRRMSGLIGCFPDSDADDFLYHAIESQIVENTAQTQRAIAEGLDAHDLPLTTVLPGVLPHAAPDLALWFLLASESDANKRADYLEHIAGVVRAFVAGDAGPQAAETAHCLAKAERAAA